MISPGEINSTILSHRRILSHTFFGLHSVAESKGGIYRNILVWWYKNSRNAFHSVSHCGIGIQIYSQSIVEDLT